MRGLRVADAAAIPHVVSGNINAAVVMVAERAADFIKEEYPEQSPYPYPRTMGTGSLLTSLVNLMRPRTRDDEK